MYDAYQAEIASYFKFQSDSINTGALAKYSGRVVSFKFQSDSINTQ